MKLLKYVMTSDTGLAPNPYFNICSLALCTPNHIKARLVPGDWIVGHSCKSSGNRLVYAMRVTKVFEMTAYKAQYPQKIPKLDGTEQERCGDSLYAFQNGRWERSPSPCHNNSDSFRQDVGCPVFLAEGPENFWYFGAANSSHLSLSFPKLFPELVQKRQGCSYVRNKERIDEFTKTLQSLSTYGLLGVPRDSEPGFASKYLIAVEPEEEWINCSDGSFSGGHSCN